jgi:putative ABC transport system ATP-binding protein
LASELATDTAVLSMRGIRRAYRTGPELLRVLTGVDLDVAPGEWVAILGASGSGKSTLLNIVGLLDQPDAGTYVLADRDVSRLDDRSRARVRNLDIGMVFQRFNLLPRTSALENVATPLLYARCGAAERSERAFHALASVGLADHVQHDSSELSGGQMQRVAIARALVNDPALLLADEPTGNLDTASGGEVLQLFSDLRAAGRTIVMITHDRDVAAYADRRLVLENGVLRQRGRSTTR